MKRLLTFGILAFLVGACRPAPPPTTPAQTATPSPTPFTVAVLPTDVPGIDVGTGRGSLPNQPPQPPAKIAVGAPVFRLPDSSADQIRSIVLNPVAPEMLISLYDGATAKTLRVRWDTPQPTIETLAGEWIQARYAPDGKSIIANGLKVLNFSPAQNQTKPGVPQPDEMAFAPNYTPDGKLVYLKRFALNDAATIPSASDVFAACSTPDEKQFCAGIVIGNEPPQGIRPYLAGPAEVSPEGKYILLTSAGEVGSTLFVYDIAAKEYRQIVPDPRAFAPEAPPLPPDAPDPNTFVSAIWSADGKKIYYVSQAYFLFEVPATGGKPTGLNDATQPHLRKGTDFLYYLKPLPGGYFEMWRRNTVSGTNERLSDAAFHCADATWSADGATLACVDVVDNERAVILYAVPK